jgi:ring-1,2-phenylacetyl-CoA epoxidase subunit PaaC
MRAQPTLIGAVTALGDDHLILGHRVSEWCGHAPMLEEDLSLPNMALDLLGQARNLYAYAAALENAGRTEDDIAYLRTDRQYRNCLLVERPNGDFAHTMLRQLYFAAFMHHYWLAAGSSTDGTLRAIANKAVKEITYHVRHAGEWIVRLGDGTEESAGRTKAAVAALHPYTEELFTVTDDMKACIEMGALPDPSGLRQSWRDTITMVFVRAGLDLPEIRYPQEGGREGLHTEDFGHLLSELQYMQRTYPGLTW